MDRRIYSLLSFFILSIPVVCGQSAVRCSFDSDTEGFKAAAGNISIAQGGLNGNALRLTPGTRAVKALKLQPGSVYELNIALRTESGADNMSAQISGLGKNNISISSAKADWTQFSEKFNVGNDCEGAKLEIIFDSNAGNTRSWADEIEIKRLGNYKEVVLDGIPPREPREIKTDLGIAMQPDDKIQWMLDGKLGMFIHWGLYAGPGQGEWYMENNGISPDEYRKLAYPESGDEYFDAKDFDPHKWMELAKKIGMKYCCLTTQHHDGYALFESKYMNAFTSKNTLNRDLVKEYVDACREAGLKVGLYKTLINWRYPGYFDVTGKDCNLDNRFGYVTEEWHKENARLMKEELYCQVKELMTKYGKIDHLFWDGGWLAQKGTDADAAPFWESGLYMDPDNEWQVNPYFQDFDSVTGKPLGIMGMVRKYQPDIVTNPRSGWIGDFTCEEGSGDVKGPIRSGVVEKCVSIGSGWGYNKQMEDSTHLMPLNRVKRLFADCLVRNMCFLLNVGPDRHGVIPGAVEQRMLQFGDWVNATKEAIYGTRGGPWQPVDGQYGFCYRGNMIYIYLLGEYSDNDFSLPSLDKGMKVRKAYNLVTGEKISVKQSGKNVKLSNINPVKDDITVIALELNTSFK